MDTPQTLKDIATGEHARILSLGCTGSMRRRLLDIGLTENTPVTCLGRSPAGDPSAYLIRGAVIAIRQKDSADIFITPQKGVSAWDSPITP